MMYRERLRWLVAFGLGYTMVILASALGMALR